MQDSASAKDEKKQPVIFLKGKMTIGRPRHPDDLEENTRWINDPEIRKNVSGSLPLTREDGREWIERKGSDKDIILAIDTLDGKHIGNMGLHKINWIARTAETGMLIGEQEYRGKGYGTDAKMILLDYAFNALGLRKICSSAISYNKASIRFNEKCGYRPDGVRKAQVFRSGKFWDLVYSAVFIEDFLPLWEEYQRGWKKE